MSICLDFDPVSGVLRAEVRGRFDLQEYREAMRCITSGKQYPETVPTIWDMRHFDFVKFDSHQALNTHMVSQSFRSRHSTRIAFVVSNPLGYGMVRMLQSLDNLTDESMIFYDYDEANRWLMSPRPQPVTGRSRSDSGQC